MDILDIIKTFEKNIYRKCTKKIPILLIESKSISNSKFIVKCDSIFISMLVLPMNIWTVTEWMSFLWLNNQQHKCVQKYQYWSNWQTRIFKCSNCEKYFQIKSFDYSFPTSIWVSKAQPKIYENWKWWNIFAVWHIFDSFDIVDYENSWRRRLKLLEIGKVVKDENNDDDDDYYLIISLKIHSTLNLVNLEKLK